LAYIGDNSAILKPGPPGKGSGQPDAPPTKPDIIIGLAPSKAKGMDATILLHPTGPNTLPPTKEDVQSALGEKGVVHGINWPLIDDLCVRPVFYHVFVAARSTPPRKGPDGYVEYLFSTSDSLAPKVGSDGVADYKNLDYIKVAEKGQLLARRHPPLQGADGVDIFGVPIEGVFGEPPMNPLGKNTYLSEGEAELYAEVSGHIRHSFGIVAIEEVLVLGAVDNKTGNIDYIGDVLVKGDVAPGFSVKATGSVVVKGTVEGAVIEAGHTLSVEGGIIGGGDMQSGSVVAGSDLRCRFLQGCEVRSSGSIYADSILLSEVHCRGDLVLSGTKSALVGGEVFVSGKVVAKQIGNDNHTPTNVNIDALSDEPTKIAELKRQVLELGTEMSQILSSLATLESERLESGSSSFYGVQTANLTTRYSECAGQREEAERSLGTLERKWEKEILPKYFVECAGTLFTGAKVTINGQALSIRDDTHRSKVQLTKDGMVITGI